MNKQMLFILCILVLASCKSTPPEVEYFELNFDAMSSYNDIHGDQIGLLTNLINDECVFKRMDKNNLSYADLVSIPLNGIVIYSLTEQGIVTSAFYESKDKRSVKQRKQKCIDKVAVGYQLPVPKRIDKVFLGFR